MELTPKGEPCDFLAECEIVDWSHYAIRQLSEHLRDNDPRQTGRNCFEWVRDEIQHCIDYQRPELTCEASSVLRVGTGFCYAKSHLLAALLRANGIPAGFVYQRLSVDGMGAPFCLHGLNAAYLDDLGWYRMDARGDKDGVRTGFTPPIEQLAFSTDLPGECDFREVWPEPLGLVVDALRRDTDALSVAANLPDVAENELA